MTTRPRVCFQILNNKINVSSVIYLKKGNAFDLQRFPVSLPFGWVQGGKPLVKGFYMALPYNYDSYMD